MRVANPNGSPESRSTALYEAILRLDNLAFLTICVP